MKLQGKTLRESCDAKILEHNYSGKGNFGQILEKYYFLYEPNSDSEPDFPIAKLELKSTSLKQLQNQEFRAKERLVLNIINYNDVIKQDFETSSFIKKNANLLIVFYYNPEDYEAIDYLIKLVGEWSFPNTDLEIIKKDWETINKKILAGKAHEISGGDTFYLEACTKGGKGGNLRSQPKSEIKAKQRAYSLKHSYLNHIISSIANDPAETYGKLIQNSNVAKEQTIEEIVISKFQPYYNFTIPQILDKLKLDLNPAAKNFNANLTKAILGVELEKEIEEFEKAGIIVKTVELQENFLPAQNLSFPAFEYEKIYDEDWRTSDLLEMLESRFLFVFFQLTPNGVKLLKAKFWNMPQNDIKEVRKVWLTTKKIIQNGNIVTGFKSDKNGKISRVTNFPGQSINPIAHVRPHATTTLDTNPLPVRDKLTEKDEYTKHSFWLNNTYVRDEIFLK